MRILVAEDDAGFARALDRSLTSWGYEPILTSNGAEAWKVLKRADSPRIAILDWEMPGPSGVELCRLLRATPHGAEVFVLMLTGKHDKSDIVEALESGADDFLSKPFHRRELQLRLAKGVRDWQRSHPPVHGGALPQANIAAGTTLGGKYRLERQIGQGGMGTVWLGVHLSLGINIAIKCMTPALAETAAYASFEREARAAAQLRNEHTVRVFDHGLDPTGLPYLVMEYLSGDTLLDRIVRTGALSPAAVVACVNHVASALTEAHGLGIVHRDVKPENILLLEDQDHPLRFSAKLIDFGLAKTTLQRSEQLDLSLAGTPSYMSPECLSGKAGATLALDCWGLAVTAFAAMTGTLPFEGDGLHDVYRHVCVDALPIPSQVAAVPPAFDGWFAKACARDPGERFASAAALGSALAAACEGTARPLARGIGRLPVLRTLTHAGR